MDKAEERLYRLASHNYSHQDKNNYNDKLSGQTQHRLRSHGIGRIFDRPLPSYDSSLYSVLNMLCSHELWTARRLNFLTFNVVPCKQNTWRHKFSAGRKFIRCHVEEAIDTKRIWQKSSEISAQFLLPPLKGVYEGHGNDNVKNDNNNSNNKNNKLGRARIF